jgi:glutaredoxin 3
MEIVMYTTPTCGYCRQAKEYLKSRKVAFVEKNVAADDAAAQDMIRRSGQRGVPVLIIGSEVIVGFDRPRIDQALARAGTDRPHLGASIADAAQVASKRNLDVRQGAYVGRITAGSSAEAAGLKVGDVLMTLAGQPIATAADVERVMETIAPGKHAAGVVWRGGSQIQLDFRF